MVPKMKPTKDLFIGLAIVSFILAIALGLVYSQNTGLREEVTGLEEQVDFLKMEYERGVMEGVNDFTLFVISKVKVCEPITLMANQESATVTEVGCG